MEEAEGHNLREIRRLRREKENDEVLEWRVRCRSERVLLIDSLLNEESPFSRGRSASMSSISPTT